jgi:hypothetical protein
MYKEFYTAIAALLPVLILAISIQSSFFIKQTKYQSPQENFPRNLHAMAVFAALAILSLAEGLALYALYNNQSHIGWIVGIAFAAITAVLFVIADFILALLDKSKEVGVYYFLIIALAGVVLLLSTVFRLF